VQRVERNRAGSRRSAGALVNLALGGADGHRDRGRPGDGSKRRPDSGERTVIEGIVSTTPGASIRVELFTSGMCDPSGFGEGRDYLTFVDVPIDAAGLGTFSVIWPTTLSLGAPVTATATDNAKDDTSEFSPCFAASTCVHVVFGHTVLAIDVNTLVWGASEDARFVKGPLASVSGCAVSGTGTFLGNSLDISADNPGLGDPVLPAAAAGLRKLADDRGGRATARRAAAMTENRGLLA